MKRITWIFFWAFFSFAFIPCIQAGEPIRFELEDEKIEFETDGRNWIEGSRNQTPEKGIIEYVLPGEKIDNWTELVTLNFFKGLQGDDLIKRFTAFTKEGLRKICSKVDWKELSEQPNGITYAWSVQSCQDWPDQSEIARVIRGKQGFYVLHYASKQVPMADEKHTQWLKLFTKAKLVS